MPDLAGSASPNKGRTRLMPFLSPMTGPASFFPFDPAASCRDPLHTDTRQAAFRSCHAPRADACHQLALEMHIPLRGGSWEVASRGARNRVFLKEEGRLARGIGPISLGDPRSSVRRNDAVDVKQPSSPSTCRWESGGVTRKKRELCHLSALPAGRSCESMRTGMSQSVHNCNFEMVATSFCFRTILRGAASHRVRK